MFEWPNQKAIVPHLPTLEFRLGAFLLRIVPKVKPSVLVSRSLVRSRWFKQKRGRYAPYLQRESESFPLFSEQFGQRNYLILRAQLGWEICNFMLPGYGSITPWTCSSYCPCFRLIVTWPLPPWRFFFPTCISIELRVLTQWSVEIWSLLFSGTISPVYKGCWWPAAFTII